MQIQKTIMKKLIYGGLALVPLTINLVACEGQQTKKSSNLEIEYRLDKIPLVKHTGSTQEAMKNPNDADEEKLNHQLFELALATKDLIKNQSFNDLVVKLARESNVQTVYYSEIKREGLRFYTMINEKLALKGMSIETITKNMTHRPILPNPEFPETAKLEIYEPSIMVSNATIANSNLQALISPNVEFEHDSLDCILAWYFDKNGVQQETLLNETTATHTTNPIFILNHSIPKKKMDFIANYMKSNKNTSPLAKSDDTYFESTRIKIKNGYRHETTGKSEFCIGGVIVRQGNPPVNFLHLGNDSDLSLNIKDVSATQVNSSSTVNVTSHHADNYLPYSDNRVFWNTFERDWNRTIKSLGEGVTFGQDWVFFGNMRYTNDWYAWLPNALTQYTHFEWFGWETEIPFSSWKSEYNLVKVD